MTKDEALERAIHLIDAMDPYLKGVPVYAAEGWKSEYRLLRAALSEPDALAAKEAECKELREAAQDLTKWLDANGIPFGPARKLNPLWRRVRKLKAELEKP